MQDFMYLGLYFKTFNVRSVTLNTDIAESMSHSVSTMLHPTYPYDQMGLFDQPKGNAIN